MVGGEEIPASPAPESRAQTLLKANTVRVTQPLLARLAPDTASDRIGTLMTDTRVRALESREGPGCSEGWLRVGPEDWVCSRYLEPDERAPGGVEIPQVGYKALIPGEYGDVRNGSAVLYPSKKAIQKGEPFRRISGHTVLRKIEELTLDDKLYWKTASGEYILAKDLKPYNPSDFHGIDLKDGLTLPLIFIMPGAKPDVPALEGPSIIPVAAGRAIARVVERQPFGRPAKGERQAYRYLLEDGTWVNSPFIRYVGPSDPPPELLADERWVDVNLDEQVLVAYEGKTPVYATLVSSGRRDPTPQGIFRIYVKYGETSMGSEMGDDRPYQIEKVPWTQFFQGDVALHCAFWHNGFGYPRSRGCVNLAPIDARHLYLWADPQPPSGWSNMYGTRKRPGTIVKVHRSNQQVFHYGYAREVAIDRGVKLKAAPKLSDQMQAAKAELDARYAAAKGSTPAPSPAPGATPASTSSPASSEKSSSSPSSAPPGSSSPAGSPPTRDSQPSSVPPVPPANAPSPEL